MAGDTDGALQGVEFFVNGEPLSTWNAYLDLNDSLPIADGKTITLNDGTGKNSIVFEVDFNEVVFGSGVPQISQDGNNLKNDLSIEGNYTRFNDTSFVIEIDGTAGTNGASTDTFRWSKDGGISYVSEKIALSAGFAEELDFGLRAKFASATGHRIGDRWSFTGRPENYILSLPSTGASTKAVTNQIRNLLVGQINELNLLGQLSILAEAGQNSDDLYLYHAMDLLYLGNAQATTDFHAVAEEFQDNLLRNGHAFGATRPYGVTWGPSQSGLYVFHASAVDQMSGNRVMSEPVVITSTTGVGQVPTVELAPLAASLLTATGELQSVSLSATARDNDGKILQVAFYANGELLGVDTSSPYGANFEVNASGTYQVYAIASDDDGNDIVSLVRRLVVEESEDLARELEISASPAYLGTDATISATYKSPTGSYDSNLRALVYVNGDYVGDAILSSYVAPLPWEEDPGQSFTYDLPARNLNGYEVEIIIINGDETASTTTSISVSASPLTSNLEFIKALYLGLFDREPHSSEYKRYFYKLEDGSMTREQVLKDLRERSEFINARNALLAYKTVNGSWAETETVLSATDQAGYGTNGNLNEGQIGSENSNPANSANTHGSTEDTATVITMNEPSIDITLDEPADVNGFKIYSLGDRQDGVFTVTVIKNGIPSNFNTDDNPESALRPNWANGLLLRARLNDGSYENIMQSTQRFEHLDQSLEDPHY